MPGETTTAGEEAAAPTAPPPPSSSSSSSNITGKKRDAPDGPSSSDAAAPASTTTTTNGGGRGGGDGGGGGDGPPAAKRPALDVLDELVQRVPIAPHKELEVTLLVPIDRVGLLIGKGGSTMKRISEDTGCKIRLQEYEDMTAKSKLRGVTLVGSLEVIERAEREVLSVLQHRRTTTTDLKGAAEEGAVSSSSSSSTRASLRWLVPIDKCGLLIGKRGIGIQQLSQESGAWIKVAHDQEMPPASTERMVYITGTEEAIEKARQLVEAKVGGRPGDGVGDDFVLVNTRAIGFVLGKKGEDLRKVSETSGAKLSVASAAELEIGTVEIKIRISGSKDQVSKAKALLTDKTDKWNKQHASTTKDKAATDPDSKETSIKLAIPKVMISGLIGKGGVGVRDMNVKSGASVRFLADEPSYNKQLDEKPLLLIGGLRNIFTAQKILYERIAALPSSVRQQAKPTTTTTTGTGTKTAVDTTTAGGGGGVSASSLLQQPTFNY